MCVRVGFRGLYCQGLRVPWRRILVSEALREREEERERERERERG